MISNYVKGFVLAKYPSLNKYFVISVGNFATNIVRNCFIIISVIDYYQISFIVFLGGGRGVADGFTATNASYAWLCQLAFNPNSMIPWNLIVIEVIF